MAVGVKGISDGTTGGETGNIIHKVVADFLEKRRVLDFVFLLDVAENESVVNIGEVAIFLGEIVVDVGAGETTCHEIVVESVVVISMNLMIL